MSNQRVATYDLMKCVGIIAMIIGHLTSVGHRFIFSWHMPLFFILAGYFYRPNDVVEMVKKDFKRLIIPYLITCGVIVFVSIFHSLLLGEDKVSRWIIASLYANGSFRHTSKFFANVPMIGAIWFLWALFWCKTIFNSLFKKSQKYVLLMCLVLSVAAMLIDTYLVNLPLAILPGMCATIFYGIGYQTRQVGGFKAVHKLVALLCVVVWIISFIYSDMSLARCFFRHYPINIVGACGGTYVIWLISDWISKYENKFTSVLVWTGRNSMTILCLHLLDLDIPIRGLLHIPHMMQIPFVIVIYLIGTYLLSKIPVTKKVFMIS